MHYHKPTIPVKDQIQLLKSRGLLMGDESLAEHYLNNISYYRLAGYWWPMQADKVNHLFKTNSRFENVVALYSFDSELRLLLFNAIKRIEIGLRTRMINHLAHEVDPWWFENPSIFKNKLAFAVNLKAIDRDLKNSKEVFIRQHYQKYHADSRRPPAWKTLEVVSFGLLSKLYGNLGSHFESKDTIAKEINTVNHTFLRTWLQSLSQIRNICAHHGRLWNKNLPGRPKLLPRPPAPWLTLVPPVSQHHALYVHVCCMKYLLDAISPGHRFTLKLKTLFCKYPSVDLDALGFSKIWDKEPLWKS
ncbi:MAG: Abi family protein [Chlorobium sp.]|nr:MAG: Abi family protein [Chlorobium sp.]